MLNGISMEVEKSEEKIKGVRVQLKDIHSMIIRNGYQLNQDQCEYIEIEVKRIYEELGGVFINA